MLTSCVVDVLKLHSHTPAAAAVEEYLHTPATAATVDVDSSLVLKYRQQSEKEDDDDEENSSDSDLSDDHSSEQLSGEEEEEDTDEGSLTDSSLSDDHSEEYPITASESEEDSELDDDVCKMGNKGQEDTRSEDGNKDYDSYPIKRSKMEEDTHLEDSYLIKRSKIEKDTHPEDGIKDYETEDKADKGIKGYDCENLKPPIPSKFELLSKCVPWMSNMSSQSYDGEYSIPDNKDNWIASWFGENGKEEQKGYHYLNVYGFYKKKTKMGGYSVVLRDPCGKPVIASASAEQEGKSYFYHVLDGVKAGLLLAKERRIFDLKLMCNSETLDGYLSQIFQNTDIGEQETGRCGYCQKCLSYAILLDQEGFEILVPLLVDIVKIRSSIMFKSRLFRHRYVRRGLNKAAYYLAKQLAREIGTLSSEGESKIEKNKLTDFEDELKTILWNDAYGDVKMYSQLLRGSRL